MKEATYWSSARQGTARIRLSIFACVVVSLFCIPFAQAQQEDPTRGSQFFFKEDSPKVKKTLEQRKQAALKADDVSKKSLDVKAPQLGFDKDQKTMLASGGILLSGAGVQAQADSARVNTETKYAELEGNVAFDGQSAEIRADKAAVNIEDETGQFTNGSFLYDDGGYSIKAKEIFKLGERQYRLIDSEMTTCTCADGSCPWSLHAEDTRITQEGYATSKNTTLWFHGVPLFYTPYFLFPAKTERSPGLLSPSVGYSRQNGIEYRQPIFFPLSDSADLQITPFVETKTRYGTFLDYKKLYNDDNSVDSRLLYSNESLRDGGLRGLNTSGLVDPTINEDRFGLFFGNVYKADQDAALPLRVISDIHYVNDGTMGREFNDTKILDPRAPVNTSTIVARSAFGDFFSGELSSEYNDLIYGTREQFDSSGTQTAIGGDKLTFNRLPELSLSYLESFRPVDNPYGLRLITKANLTQTYFDRDVGYDGARTNFNPQGTIPFHFSNYLSGNVAGGAYIRAYSLNETLQPIYNNATGGYVETDPTTGTSTYLDSSKTSSVPYLSSQLGTAFERVYDVDKNGFWANLASLGKDNQDNKLARVKHVIEPTLKYLYIPDISQGEVPQFDTVDRITERSLVRYGVSTSLLGRYSPRKDVATGFPELTPELRDFPAFDAMNAIPELGNAQGVGPVGGISTLRDGSVRELLRLSIEQGYDFRQAYRRDQEKTDTGSSDIQPFTDITTGITTSPTQNFALRLDNLYNTEESRFTGWALTSQFSSDRGDSLFARYTFVGPDRGNADGEDKINQIDGGAEGVVTDRLRLGLYAQYDSIKGELLNTRSALRFYSACNCWHVDLGYADRLNPDNQTFYLNFTLTGLGSLSQNLYNVNGNGQ
jgi:LPS-assembly protein